MKKETLKDKMKDWENKLRDNHFIITEELLEKLFKINKQFIKDILEEIVFLNSPFEENNYDNRLFNSGFRNMRRNVLRIIRENSGFEDLK